MVNDTLLMIHSPFFQMSPLLIVSGEIILALLIRYLLSTLSITKKYRNNTLVYRGFLLPSIKNNSQATYGPLFQHL